MKSSTFFSPGDYVATKVRLVVAAVLVSLLSLLPGTLAWVRGRPLEVTGQDPTGSPGPIVAFTLDRTGLFLLVIGLLLLVLAEGFRVGHRLRDDVEGLV